MITAMRHHIVPAIFVLGMGVCLGVAMVFSVGEVMAEEAKAPELPKLPKLPELPKAPPAVELPIEYFVAVEGKQAGPFKCSKLLEMANGHTLTPESKVWKAGMPNWRRAGGMQDLDAIFAAVPPPVNDDSSPLDAKPAPAALPCVPKPKKWWWPF